MYKWVEIIPCTLLLLNIFNILKKIGYLSHSNLKSFVLTLLYYVGETPCGGVLSPGDAKPDILSAYTWKFFMTCVRAGLKFNGWVLM